eukprot:8663998-Lingulodinium_polyedra.AAC.1
MTGVRLRLRLRQRLRLRLRGAGRWGMAKHSEAGVVLSLRVLFVATQSTGAKACARGTQGR